jgi:anti-anti-sigma factor
MIIRDNDALIINPPQELTIHTLNGFVEVIRPELKDFQSLLVNLVGVTEIDSAGFQILISLKNEAIKQNKNFSIVGMSMDVDEMISLYRADSYLNG